MGLKTTLKSEKSHENIRLSSDARKKENQRDVGATRTTWTGSVETPGRSAGLLVEDWKDQLYLSERIEKGMTCYKKGSKNEYF